MKQYEKFLKEEEEQRTLRGSLLHSFRRSCNGSDTDVSSFSRLRRRNTFPSPGSRPKLAYLSSQYSTSGDTASYQSIPECESSTSSLVNDVTVTEAAKAIAEDEKSWNEIIQTIRSANVVTSVAASMVCIDIFRDKAKEMTLERIRKAEEEEARARVKKEQTIIGKMKRRMTLW